jgi:hypothetical protein
MEGGTMPFFSVYKLTLHKTYYEKGFFNLGVDVDRFVRPDSGPITIVLGDSGIRIKGRVDRTANRNGTPRVFGNAKLKHWIQSHFKLKDKVNIYIKNPEEILIKEL